jgi:hypothetical protein
MAGGMSATPGSCGFLRGGLRGECLAPLCHLRPRRTGPDLFRGAREPVRWAWGAAPFTVSGAGAWGVWFLWGLRGAGRAVPPRPCRTSCTTGRAVPAGPSGRCRLPQRCHIAVVLTTALSPRGGGGGRWHVTGGRSGTGMPDGASGKIRGPARGGRRAFHPEKSRHVVASSRSWPARRGIDPVVDSATWRGYRQSHPGRIAAAHGIRHGGCVGSQRRSHRSIYMADGSIRGYGGGRKGMGTVGRVSAAR